MKLNIAAFLSLLSQKRFVSRCFCMAIALSVAGFCFADSDKPVPQPRKRLGRDSSAVETERHGGQSVIGEVQTNQAQYTNALQAFILANYNASVRKLDDEVEFRDPIKVRVRVWCKDSVVDVLGIEGRISDRRRALLGMAISNAAKKVTCPAEFYEHGIRYFEYEFSLALFPSDK